MLPLRRMYDTVCSFILSFPLSPSLSVTISSLSMSTLLENDLTHPLLHITGEGHSTRIGRTGSCPRDVRQLPFYTLV